MVHLSEKRYYPYGSLASNMLGFCGSDNQGLYGLEQKWDSILTGTPGRIITQKDASQDFFSSVIHLRSWSIFSFSCLRAIVSKAFVLLTFSSVLS